MKEKTIKFNEMPNPVISCDFKNVYAPSDDTYLLLNYFKKKIDLEQFDSLNIRYIKRILDMGTGTGIIAIFFQLLKKVNRNFVPEIHASDISEEAIKSAKENEKRNNVENTIYFKTSDLFKSFPEKLKHAFDVIVFNPPYLPSSDLIKEGENKLIIDSSWDGGREGIEVFIRFLNNVKDFLNLQHTSYIYYVSSSQADLKKLNEKIEGKGFKNIILDKIHIFFEDIFLNRLERFER